MNMLKLIYFTLMTKDVNYNEWYILITISTKYDHLKVEFKKGVYVCSIKPAICLYYDPGAR